MATRSAQHGSAEDDPWMTAAEAAEYVKCSPETIKMQAKLAHLRGTKLLPGSKRSEWRFRRSWVDQWLEAGAMPRSGR